MKLVRLHVQKLPGIRPGFVLDDLDPGITLVVGPNACGKSSIVRALRHLVADDDVTDPTAVALAATFEGEDARWTVEKAGTTVAWKRDGAPAEAPPLPDPRFFSCYWLAVEELLDPGHDGDGDIADRIRREMAGGYDLDALLERDAPFGVGVRHGGSEAKRLRQAEASRREVAGRYERLQRERARLPELERRIRERSDVRERIAAVETAQELLEARRARVDAERALEAFPASPEAMRRLRGDEGETLDELDGRRSELEGDRDEHRRDRARARQTLETTGLADGAPDAEDVRRHRKALEEVGRQLEKRSAERGKRDGALARARTAARRLGAPGDELPDLSPDAVSDAEELASTLLDVRQRIRELEARLDGAPEAPEPADLEACRDAAGALRAWTAAAGTQLERQRMPLVAVVLGALVAAVAALMDRPVVAAAAAAVALLGAAGALLPVLAARRERAAARSRFEEQDLEPPSAWTGPDVEARLEELEARLAELRERDTRARRVEGDRERLDEKRERLRRLEERKEELARRVGFDPEKAGASLHQFATLVSDLHEARTDADAIARTLEGLDAEIRSRLRSVASFLEEWGEEPDGPGAGEVDPLEASDLALEAVSAGLERLSRRCEEAEDARRTVEKADEEIRRIEGELDHVRSREEKVFERAGLEPGRRADLDARLEARDDFRERDEARREAEIAESQLRSRLEGEDELLVLVEDDAEDALRDRLDALRQEEDELENLKAERSEITGKIDQAGTDRALEEALAEVEASRTALADARDEALLAEAGAFLLDEVKEEHRQEHEPAVLRHARERFQRFTHHRWSLELDEDAGFVARDCEWDELRRLSELSSGTRMQLLLAVRVAWTRTLERGREPLPLFLDEALTTSDPDRFERVAESLRTLADEEGRQIVYLCARPADVHLWERALGTRPRTVDLAEVRFDRASDAVPDDYVLPERERIPSPDGDGPEAYAAKLAVPPVDPWSDPGAVHLFHLLRDDLPLLHGLLAGWGVRTQGQLGSLLESAAGEHAVEDEDARRRLEGRCLAVRSWIRAWRAGRGRPVHRGVLEASGAVSGTFIDEVTELTEELNGDPRALLEELPDVPRFRSSKVEELRTWLEEHDYLLPGEPLDAAGRESRVLREVAGRAEPGDVRRVVRWLEAGADGAG